MGVAARRKSMRSLSLKSLGHVAAVLASMYAVTACNGAVVTNVQPGAGGETGVGGTAVGTSPTGNTQSSGGTTGSSVASSTGSSATGGTSSGNGGTTGAATQAGTGGKA